MKADKKTETDQLEKEMKLLIEKLNNENAALGKILENMGEKKVEKNQLPMLNRKNKSEIQIKTKK